MKHKIHNLITTIVASFLTLVFNNLIPGLQNDKIILFLAGFFVVVINQGICWIIYHEKKSEEIKHIKPKPQKMETLFK